MPRILSGIRPSGELHLGNYLGAIKQWIELQDQHEVFYMVADLHAITTPYDPKQLPRQVRETVVDYLAAGLDPKRAVIFVQSHVPAHSQLMWLLNTMTPIGELQRMVQFKEKSEQHKDFQNAGILNYPILQAADILAYKPQAVPVGDDQDQHVELARDLAKKFNRQFGQTFHEVKSLHTSGKRIMDLADPSKKMSKSLGGGIGLNDSPTDIEKKLKKAVTSSEPRIIREAMHAAQDDKKTAELEGQVDPNQIKQFHGVRNLFVILQALGTDAQVAEWREQAENGSLQFSKFKPAVATVIADHFAAFREQRQKFANDPDLVSSVLADGNQRANVVAEKTLAEVQKKMGLRA